MRRFTIYGYIPQLPRWWKGEPFPPFYRHAWFSISSVAMEYAHSACKLWMLFSFSFYVATTRMRKYQKQFHPTMTPLHHKARARVAVLMWVHGIQFQCLFHPENLLRLLSTFKYSCKDTHIFTYSTFSLLSPPSMRNKFRYKSDNDMTVDKGSSTWVKMFHEVKKLNEDWEA